MLAGYPDGIDPVARAGLRDRGGQVVADGACGKAEACRDLRRAGSLRGLPQHLHLPRGEGACRAVQYADGQAGIDDPLSGSQLPDRLSNEFRWTVMDQESMYMCRDGALENMQPVPRTQ